MLTREKEILLEKVDDSLRLSGWQLLLLNDEHPVRARAIQDDQTIDAWIHIWNVSSGGRPGSRPLERRVQVTNIGDRFRASPGVHTLILGWSPEAEVFAAFDHRFHSGAIGTSSSLQTDLHALQDAAQNGIGVFAKNTGELSIAVRPDMLGVYLEQMDVLHASGMDGAMLDVLRRMAASPLDVEPDDIPKKRRRVMTTTLKLLRDRRFSQQVLDAYRHRCAFCEVQLRLLDAAHILPVGHPDSNDKVTNGVALCALHHRSYDTGLVTFDCSYAIKVSPKSAADLKAEGRGGGIVPFRSALRPMLLLPPKQAFRPSPSMINKANALRGWA